MDQISVTNFRRFYYVTPRNLGDINIFVGGNNSGKSTLVKAILLAVDNIRTMRMGGSDTIKRPQFRFDANQYHDVKIGTYTRALCHKPEYDFGRPSSFGNRIELAFVIGDYEFTITMTGDEKGNEPTATITKIDVVNMKYGLRFAYLGEYNCILSQILLDPREKREKLWELAIRHKEIIQELSNISESGNLSAITSLNSELDKTIQSITAILKELHIPEEDEEEDDDYWLENYHLDDTELYPLHSLEPLYTIDSKEPQTRLIQALIDDQFSSMVSENLNRHQHSKATVTFPFEQERLSNNDYLICEMIDLFVDTLSPIKAIEGNEEVNNVESYQMIQQELPQLEAFRDELRSLLNSINIEYISAHSANQNVIYSTTDKNDHIAKAIHDFFSENIKKGSLEALFVLKWMKELGVGEDYEITPIQGEAYTVDIKEKYLSDEEEHEDHVNLADKGMGSIQIMVMLFRIAATLRRFNLTNKTSKELLYKPIIVIEEPEQNLHPNLQTKLADLLKEVSEKYHCRFIVETHSEYLVRKVQVLVAQEKYESEKELNKNNPFNIMYFQQNDDPYEMEFRTDGKFSNDFGEGFYDEASNLAFEIF